jgi:putative thiamine transport system ATP-binding protein
MSLILDRLAITRHGRPLIGPLSLTVAPGEMVTVMGPSGAGKSTLLDVVTGTLAPAFRATGRVTLDGRDLTGLAPEARAVGLLFQDPMLFPHLSVAGNLAFGMPRSVRRAERRARVEAALSEAGLAGMGERDPATLSGGQAARVALMRVLLSEPRTLLLDEPFSRLDVALRARMRDFVRQHVTRRGLPALLVTHDPADAGGRVIRLDQPAGGLPSDEPPGPA